MQLWNDYEGKTLAGTFPIEMLLRTEGRNASFATHDRNGRPAVLRLTEALNDEQELRERYGAIQDVGQQNLVTIEDFGATEIEGTPLIYLVMESTEENLEEIVRQRSLSVEETGELALSLTAAIEALHAHGLVHGMVEPASVMAAGQVIKLRSDCVRPAPEGAEGMRARAQDVFGLADVLHRALTQRPLRDASDALALPEPYAAIVRNVARGSWGIEQVASELRRLVRSAVASASAADEPAMAAAAAPGVLEAALPPNGHKPAGAGLIDPVAAPRRFDNSPGEQMLLLPDEFEARATRAEHGHELDARRSNGRPMAWLAGVAGVLALVLLSWHFAGLSGNGGRAAAKGPAAALPTAAAVHAAPSVAAAAPAAIVSTRAAVASGGGAVWRVVAYTYNVQSQAEAKAHRIAERNADLRPEVYSRTGHAPYLVTLGGALSRQEAASMLQHARRQGMARDVYMQNYSR